MRRSNHNFGISFFIGFISVLGVACSPQREPSVTLVSQDEKATGILIRGVGIDEEKISSVKVRLAKAGERSPILGSYSLINDDILFEPVVPFTRGLTYEVLVEGRLLTEIKIPSGAFSPPQLQAIYPSADTLPENLLKMYFQFSEPMVEGSSLSHIVLVRNDRDTMEGTFLDLQPELWNAEGTVLTLWLDPGRIKRDLIPNKELGAPLKASEKYTLTVNASWQSKQGLSLPHNYTKSFVTEMRDDVSPTPSSWKTNVPSVGNRHPFVIHFEKPVDYFLAKNTIVIKKHDGSIVPGNVELDEEETVFRFIPAQPWIAGKFVLYIESRLEDLAGNNLNRPFDRDVSELPDPKSKDDAFFMKEFQIR